LVCLTLPVRLFCRLPHLLPADYRWILPYVYTVPAFTGRCSTLLHRCTCVTALHTFCVTRVAVYCVLPLRLLRSAVTHRWIRVAILPVYYAVCITLLRLRVYCSARYVCRIALPLPVTRLRIAWLPAAGTACYMPPHLPPAVPLRCWLRCSCDYVWFTRLIVTVTTFTVCRCALRLRTVTCCVHTFWIRLRARSPRLRFACVTVLVHTCGYRTLPTLLRVTFLVILPVLPFVLLTYLVVLALHWIITVGLPFCIFHRLFGSVTLRYSALRYGTPARCLAAVHCRSTCTLLPSTLCFVLPCTRYVRRYCCAPHVITFLRLILSSRPPHTRLLRVQLFIYRYVTFIPVTPLPVLRYTFVPA